MFCFLVVGGWVGIWVAGCLGVWLGLVLGWCRLREREEDEGVVEFVAATRGRWT